MTNSNSIVLTFKNASFNVKSLNSFIADSASKTTGTNTTTVDATTL
ncbi:MAG: hypothetical protein HRT35_06175 [Algicola sp.]|nr:hypothetical protein [Algicola sp.]